MGGDNMLEEEHPEICTLDDINDPHGEPEEMTNAEYLKLVAEFTVWLIKQTGAP